MALSLILLAHTYQLSIINKPSVGNAGQAWEGHLPHSRSTASPQLCINSFRTFAPERLRVRRDVASREGKNTSLDLHPQRAEPPVG